MKNLIKITIIMLVTTSLYSNMVLKKQCEKKEGNFIFAGKECINYFIEEGDRKDILNIIIHGAWKNGTNTLARYSPFASNISLNTDITTIAIALPSYSKSSSNYLKSLMHNGKKSVALSTSKQYIDFLVDLIKELKNKYKAKTINVIAHSAGAILSATITGYKPNLIQNVVLAGGQYNLERFKNKSGLTIDKFLKDIPKSTNFLLVYGTKDNISKPKITKDFYNKLKRLKLNVKMIEVKEHKHLDLDMSDESVEAITSMFE
jgi:alpha-beta hydrolase superfamily lysophospholipase